MKTTERLEVEIKRLLDDIDEAYRSLGKSIHDLSSQKIMDINEKVDQVVELKKELRKLRGEGRE